MDGPGFGLRSSEAAAVIDERPTRDWELKEFPFPDEPIVTPARVDAIVTFFEVVIVEVGGGLAEKSSRRFTF